MSLLERCPHFRGWYLQASMELGPEDVSLLERCPHFRGWYVQASMELGPEDVSLLERCPHFRGWYVQASMELVPEDVSLLERCPFHTHTHTLQSQQCIFSCVSEPTIRMLILDTVSILLEHHSRLCRADSENGLENEERLFDVPIRMVSDINQQVSVVVWGECESECGVRVRECKCGVRCAGVG